MAQRRKIIYRTYSWEINSPDQQIIRDFDIDRKVREIVGIRLDSARTERGTIKIEISNDELFGDDFPARLLDFSNASNRRFFDDFFINADGKKGSIMPGNYRMRVQYQDNSFPGAPAFATYRVALTLQCVADE
jgi:hypothetical protein